MQRRTASAKNRLVPATSGISHEGLQPGIRNQRTLLFTTALIGVVQALLLAWAIWPNKANLNPDGIAYLRLATYYSEWKTSLMISGYWGPMLSWIAAAFVKLGLPVLLAGRLTMALSAAAFAWGSRSLLRSLPLQAWAQQTGFALAALCSVFWSVEYISPDLLVAGLVCFAASRMSRPGWAESTTESAISGVLWGLAYLAKAVALPMTVLMGVVVACLWQLREGRTWTTILRRLATTWCTCLLVGLPWMTALSIHYGTPTFSTSARIAHAVVGPPDVDRYHPFARTFHKPDPGRITAWEDPSGMPYHYWSPFANADYFGHQLSVIARNALTVLTLLGGFDLIHTGLIGLAGCLVIALHHRRAAARSWLLLPAMVFCATAIYLPVYLQIVDQRYFYACYPVMWSAVAGALAWLGATRSGLRRALAWVFGGCSLVSFVTPAVLGLMMAITGLPDSASNCADDLAKRLNAIGTEGPVAGSGMVSGARTGLYLAFRIGQPWYGDTPKATPADYERSGARLIVVNRKHPISIELDSHPSFRSLDDRLFGSEEEASLCPVRVYEVPR